MSLVCFPGSAHAEHEGPAGASALVVIELGVVLIEANAFDGHIDGAWAPILWGVSQLVAGSVLLAVLDDPLGSEWAALAGTLLAHGGWHAIGFPAALSASRVRGPPEADLQPSVSFVREGAVLQLSGSL